VLRYQDLLHKAEISNGPSLDLHVDAFSDSTSLSNTRGLVRLGTPIRAFQLLGSIGHSSYAENGSPRFQGTEGGLELRYFPLPGSTLDISYTRRQLVAVSEVQNFDVYGFQGTLLLEPELRLSLEDRGSNVETAAAIASGVKQNVATLTVEWDPGVKNTINLSGDTVDYSDDNWQRDIRLALGRKLTDWLALGDSFWYGNSGRSETIYWTPSDLRQDMGTLTLSHTEGDLRGSLLGGWGYGADSVKSAQVQMATAVLDWRIIDHLNLNASAAYSRSPSYISRQISASIILRY
jgi:hypothetical protein